METSSHALHKTLTIEGLCALHAIDTHAPSPFTFPPHGGWELVYVDKGTLTLTADRTTVILSGGDMYVLPPHTGYRLHRIVDDPAVAMRIAFSCASEALTALAHKSMKLGASRQELLARLFAEGHQVFAGDGALTVRENAPLGGEQLVELYLSELLLLLLRELDRPLHFDHRTGSHPLLDAIVAYMQQHIHEKLTLAKLAEQFHISPSRIKALFTQYKRVGAMHFFIEMKIAYAKTYLQESDYNVSQIADLLGYDNVYYFCNQFKSMTRMSPLEYRHAVSVTGLEPVTPYK